MKHHVVSIQLYNVWFNNKCRKYNSDIVLKLKLLVNNGCTSTPVSNGTYPKIINKTIASEATLNISVCFKNPFE